MDKLNLMHEVLEAETKKAKFDNEWYNLFGDYPKKIDDIVDDYRYMVEKLLEIEGDAILFWQDVCDYCDQKAKGKEPYIKPDADSEIVFKSDDDFITYLFIEYGVCGRPV